MLIDRDINNRKAGIETEPDSEHALQVVCVDPVVWQEKQQEDDGRGDAQLFGSIGGQNSERPAVVRRPDGIDKNARRYCEPDACRDVPDAGRCAESFAGNIDYGKPPKTDHDCLGAPADVEGGDAAWAEIPIDDS